MKTIQITSAVKLTDQEVATLKSALKLSTADECQLKVDSSIIAGLAIEVDGVAIDLTVKRQLTEIAQE